MSEVLQKLRERIADWHLNSDKARVSVKLGLLRETASRIAELEADLAAERGERQLLQDILDSRPAINRGLPDTYIRWSQSIYSGDMVRASLADRGQQNGSGGR
jgi:hypothetical protein